MPPIDFKSSSHMFFLKMLILLNILEIYKLTWF